MNLYKVTDIETGETFEGTAEDFTHIGLSDTYIYKCAKMKMLGRGKYLVECSQKCKRNYNPKKVVVMTELERLNQVARDHGSDYGQYVHEIEGMHIANREYKAWLERNA